MNEVMEKKSSRRFSKFIMTLTVVLTFALMFFSILMGQGALVITGGYTLIGALFSIYTGVGHMDMRKAVEAALGTATKTVAK